MICEEGTYCSISDGLLQKFTLLATTGSSQPRTIFQIPGELVSEKVGGGVVGKEKVPWKTQGALYIRTSPRLSG